MDAVSSFESMYLFINLHDVTRRKPPSLIEVV